MLRHVAGLLMATPVLGACGVAPLLGLEDEHSASTAAHDPSVDAHATHSLSVTTSSSTVNTADAESSPTSTSSTGGATSFDSHDDASTSGEECPPEHILCDAECIDPRSDDRYCGANPPCEGEQRGYACSDEHACTAGACIRTECPGGYRWETCGGECFETNFGEARCGAFDGCQGDGDVPGCGPGEACVYGNCGDAPGLGPEIELLRVPAGPRLDAGTIVFDRSGRLRIPFRVGRRFGIAEQDLDGTVRTTFIGQSPATQVSHLTLVMNADGSDSLVWLSSSETRRHWQRLAAHGDIEDVPSALEAWSIKNPKVTTSITLGPHGRYCIVVSSASHHAREISCHTHGAEPVVGRFEVKGSWSSTRYALDGELPVAWRTAEGLDLWVAPSDRWHRVEPPPEFDSWQSGRVHALSSHDGLTLIGATSHGDTMSIWSSHRPLEGPWTPIVPRVSAESLHIECVQNTPSSQPLLAMSWDDVGGKSWGILRRRAPGDWEDPWAYAANIERRSQARRLIERPDKTIVMIAGWSTSTGPMGGSAGYEESGILDSVRRRMLPFLNTAIARPATSRILGVSPSGRVAMGGMDVEVAIGQPDMTRLIARYVHEPG